MTEQAWRQWVTLAALIVLTRCWASPALLALVLMEALFAGLGCGGPEAIG